MGDKGRSAEEALKSYFWNLGYYAVRGMRIRIGTNDVTDIDLWLYNRPSPLTRERINVDVKNKRTPQALERVFWAKGVQTVLGFDGCIVATTDKRLEVVEFGRTHGVTVLDGNLLKKILEKPGDESLTEEEFASTSARHRVSRAQEGWYEKLDNSKIVLGQKLGYDACNHMLGEIRYFANQALLGGPRTSEAVRYLYLLTSYFLISLDFAVSELPFLNLEERQKRIEDGIRYGNAGKAGTERITELVARIARASMPGSNPALIRDALRRTSEAYPAEILGEFFGRTQIQNSLFQMARDFAGFANRPEVLLPTALVNGARATLFVLLDFLQISRVEFTSRIGSSYPGDAAGGTPRVPSTAELDTQQVEMSMPPIDIPAEERQREGITDQPSPISTDVGNTGEGSGGQV